MADDLHPFIPIYTTGGPEKLTIDDLIARLPKGTYINLSYGFRDSIIGVGYAIEIGPERELIEGDERWPWREALIFDGPTSEDVINQADEALRKVKR